MAEDSPDFYVLHYGPVAISYLQTECKKPVDVHALKATFRYQAHRKETLRTYFQETQDLKIVERKKSKKFFTQTTASEALKKAGAKAMKGKGKQKS